MITSSSSESAGMCFMPHGRPVIQVLYRASLYSAGLMPGTALQPVLAMLTASADGLKAPLPLLPAAVAVADLTPALLLEVVLVLSKVSSAVAKHDSAVALLLADSGDFRSSSSLHRVMSLLSRFAGVMSAEGPPNRLRLG